MMQHETCPLESSILAAERSGRWEEALVSHLDSCAHCRETLAIGGWMQTLRKLTPTRIALPDPDLIWLKYRLLGRQAAADRALEPLFLGETLVQALGAAFAAIWLAFKWPGVQDSLGNWLSGTAAGSISEAAANPLLLTAGSLAVAALLAAAALAIHPLLTRN